MKALLARGADVAGDREGRRHQRAQSRGRRREPRAQRARRRDPERARRRQAASAGAAAPARRAARRARAAARTATTANEPEPLGYADLVGAHGGLTALLLAAREGLDETAFALLDGGADINQVSASDRTSPLLMATINGHFDLAMRLLARGADVRGRQRRRARRRSTACSTCSGRPRRGIRSRRDYMQQKIGYLELAEAMLKAGADPNARLSKSLWYTTYNRDLLGVDRTGATPFWLAAYTLDIPAMQLLLEVRRRSQRSARRRCPSATKRAARIRAVPIGRACRRFRGADRRWRRFTPRRASATASASPATRIATCPDGWVPAVKFLVEELGADVNARDHNGYTPLHHAASRGDNELISYLVSKGADVKAVSRSGQTTVDMANGPVQRVQPFPETVALLESLGAKNNNKCVSC